MKDHVLLFRPWSYVATLAPFLLAAALGGRGGDASWLHWGAGLLVGLLFQAAVNLLNTWGDERSGVDAVPGAVRTTPQLHDGVVSAETVLGLALASVAAGAAIGSALCFRQVDGRWVFDWRLLVLGVIGALGALNYTTGVKFKYRGLGVPFVSILMGVLETFAAQLLLSPRASLGIVPTLPIALLVGAVMHGNDMRDIRTDRAAGIRTLASALGARLALGYYCLAHLLPYALALALAGGRASLVLLVPLPLTLRTVGLAVRVYRGAAAGGNPDCPPWRGLERQTGLVLLVFGAAYSAALALR